MPEPFFLASWTDPADSPAFQGFGFSGADVVIGAEGHAAFAATRGPDAQCDDGNFILMRQTPDGAVLRTDTAGYRHLFYYAQDDLWAVGESFVGLVAALRGKGVSLTEDPLQTAAWFSRRQVFQQLVSRNTAVRGIRLLGGDEALRVTAAGLTVLTQPRRAPRPYGDALRDCLNLWLSRTLTLSEQADTHLFFHLSGGIDSRAVASFFLWLRRQDLLPERAGLRSLTDAAHAEDLVLAQRLCAQMQVPLNALHPRPHRPLTQAEIKGNWDTQALGVYAPLLLPSDHADPRDLHFTGHGGGGYKANLSAAQVKDQIARMARHYGAYAKGDARRWRQGFEAELAMLDADPGQAWARFQRDSRSRFHGGQAASYKTQVAIFDSVWTEAAGRAGLAEGRRSFQLHYDIMASLAPEVLDVPFDTSAKAPDVRHRKALIRLNGLTPQAGRRFGAFPAPLPALEDPQGQTALDQLADELRDGWRDLPLKRLGWTGRWRMRSVLRDVAKGRTDPVRLRHMHGALLMLRLRRLGVSFEDL